MEFIIYESSLVNISVMEFHSSLLSFSLMMTSLESLYVEFPRSFQKIVFCPLHNPVWSSWLGSLEFSLITLTRSSSQFSVFILIFVPTSLVNNIFLAAHSLFNILHFNDISVEFLIVEIISSVVHDISWEISEPESFFLLLVPVLSNPSEEKLGSYLSVSPVDSVGAF